MDAASRSVQHRCASIGHLFQKNRWWSNPALTNVDTMIALILADPTKPDLALAAALWGTERVSRVRSLIKDELTPIHLQVLEPIYASVMQGIEDAPERSA